MGGGVGLGSPDAGQHRLELDAARGVGLGVEEDLGVEDVLRPGLLEVGPRQVVEVLLRQQDAHPLVVLGEEGRQVVEVVGGPHLGGRGVRQVHPVAAGEDELELRLERPLDVEVELGLGDAGDERFHDCS